MKIYTFDQLIQLSGLSYGVLRKLRDNSYFKNMYKDKLKYYFPQEDVDKLLFDVNFYNDSYTTEEFEKLLGYSPNNAGKKLIDKFSLEIDKDYIFFRNRYYFNKETVNTLTSSIDNINIDKTKYLLISDCSRELKSEHYIYDGISKGYIKDFKTDYQGRKYVSIDEFEKAKLEVSIINNSYSTNDIASLCCVEFKDISTQKLSKFPHKMIRRRNYYNKSEIDSAISKYESAQVAFNELFCTTYNVTNRNALDLPIVSHIPDGYISISNMCKKYNYSRDVFYESVKNKRLEKSVRYKKFIYIYENEFLDILDKLSNSLSINEIKNILFERTGIKFPIQSKEYSVKRFFPNAFFSDLLGLKHYRVYKSDFDDFLNTKLNDEILDMDIKNEKDPHKLYELLCKKLPLSNYSYTISCYKNFATNTINNSIARDKRNLSFRLHSSLREFLSITNKDFNELNDIEISELLNMLNSTHKLYISNFLNYHKAKSPDDCSYVNHYNRYVDIKESDSTDIYSEEEWFKYLEYLSNVDLHILKAFHSQLYSKIWLYTLLHFVVSWRSKDILNLPNLDILDIDKYTLDWFKNNEFTLTDAQYIINITKLVWDDKSANKNNIKNQFIVFKPLLIPVSIVILICEQHRRNNNNDNLLGKTVFIKSHLQNNFGDNLNEFLSLKANRSIMTYCFNEAVDKVGYSEISYSLASILRGHTVGSYELAPVTEQYIYATNKDGDANSVALHLQQRGIFGWLYKAIIDIAFDTTDYKLLDMTDEIISFKKQLSVDSIEGLSKFLHNDIISKSEIINELKSIDKPKLKTLIENILNGKSPSKVDNTYCIKFNNCPYKTDIKCYCCKYSIPTNYTLNIISSKLIELLDKLDSCDIDDGYERIYYSHQIIKLMYIIKDAKEEFCKFDSSSKEYVDTFLELNRIKDMFSKVSSNKLLLP